jgi:hypothetical protein
MTFPSLHVADQWYRAVTTSIANGNKKFAGIKRISPQLYQCDESIYNTLNEVAVALKHQITFSPITSGTTPPILPVIKCTNHVSGKW